MKFSTVLLTSALAFASVQSACATPIYHHKSCLLGNILCVDHGYTTDRPHHGIGWIHAHNQRQLPTLNTLVGGLPILGSSLQPLLPLLGAIGLSEIDVSSQDVPSLTEEQLSTLADLEYVLLDAAHEITSGTPTNSTPTAPLQARGLIPLGSLLTGLPFIGPFLQPLLPILESIGLASVDASPGAIYSMSLDENQTSKLAQLKAILEEDIPEIMPGNDSDGSSSSSDTSSDDSQTPNEADTPASTPAPSESGESGP